MTNTTSTETAIETDHGRHFFAALAGVMDRARKDHLPGAARHPVAWFNDPICQGILAEGIRIGAVTRWSTTQIEWTDAGAARHQALRDEWADQILEGF